MRTEKTDRVFLTLPTRRPETLKNIKIGDEFAAGIVIRHGKNDAVLEIAGVRIRASFPRGVPASSFIHLQLEKIEKNAFFFKLIGDREVISYKESILDHTILPRGRDIPYLRLGIARFVESGAASVFALSAILSDIDRRKLRDESPALLLRKLAALGFGGKAIRELAELLIFSNLPPEGAFILLRTIFGDDSKKWGAGKGSDREDPIKNLIEEIDVHAKGDSAEEALEIMIKFLGFRGGNEQQSGWTVALPIGDEIVPVRYLIGADSIFLELTLSGLGTIDILGKRTDGWTVINLYCENADAKDMLSASAGDLVDIEKKIGCSITVNIYRMNDIINKIVEIYSHYGLNSEIDIKV